jgi:hypothetical protein
MSLVLAGFGLLLNGPYQPVAPGTAPDLGLSRVGVNLNDGSYMKTQIFPVHVEGIPCNANENTAIGTFYVQFGPRVWLSTNSPEVRLQCSSFPIVAV